MRLARIQGDDRCVLTVYFPGSLARGKSTRSTWAELPASLLPTESLTQDELEHRRRALELWEDVTPGVELPPAHGWVGVVSWMTEDAVFVQLPAAVEPAAHLDNSAFLLPAGRLLDAGLLARILVRVRARQQASDPVGPESVARRTR